MTSIRRKIIHLLGGLTWDDIHPMDQIAILQRKNDTWIDRQTARILDVERSVYTNSKDL